MASITEVGFCDVAPLSKKVKGLPRTSVERMGKSARTRAKSNEDGVVTMITLAHHAKISTEKVSIMKGLVI